MIKDQNKGNLLFPDCQMIKRVSPSQREFEEYFSSELSVFDEILTKSFLMLKQEEEKRPPHYRNRNWHPNTMNSNVQGLLIDHFGGHVKLINGRYFLSLYGKLLSFKKLDSCTLKPTHNETSFSSRLVNQFALPMEEPNPIIWVGYCVDNPWNNLMGTYALSMDGNELNWVVNLSNEESTTEYFLSSDKLKEENQDTPLVSIKSEIKKAL